jgi:cytidylate kinase
MTSSSRDNASRRKPGIVISGLPAVGKTTIAREIAKEFDLDFYNGGDILKMLASEKGYLITGKDWWDTDEAKKFMSERRSNPLFDKEVDHKLVDIVMNGNVVITSYTVAWLVPQPIKLWLKGSETSRVRRMAIRDNISLEQAKKIIHERDSLNIEIYRNLYGFDFGKDLSVFDFMLNTDLISLACLIEFSKSIIRSVI